MSLNSKSLVELRAIAQTIGLVPRFDHSKAQLIQDIALHTQPIIKEPEKQVVVNIPHGADKQLTQESITKALADFFDLGLQLSFPDEYTWSMECNGRKDSGSMTIGMWNIVQCAREMVKS